MVAVAPRPDPRTWCDAIAVPEMLRSASRWIAWKYVWRDAKETKAPLCPLSGANSDVTNPLVHTDFHVAFAVSHDLGTVGIGFVFMEGEGWCGIDLDDCVDEHGVISPAALALILMFNSYTEFSPSGTGIKIFIRGRKPLGAKCTSKAVEGIGKIEVYDHGRYFTVTGRHVPGTPTEVRDAQEALDTLCARLWPPAKARSRYNAGEDGQGFGGDDDALIARMRAAQNGAKFSALFDRGDTSAYGGDESAADLALCNQLAFWTGKDAARMDCLFRRSGLFREKWDEMRGARTYGQMTIDRAIAGCQEVFTARGRPAPSSTTGPEPEPGPKSEPGPEPAREPNPESEPGDGSTGEPNCIPLGSPDPISGRLVLSPKRTLPTAQVYVRQFNQHPEGRTLHSYSGVLMEWRGNRYCQVEDGWVKQRLQIWLHGALRYHVKRSGAMELVDFDSNPTTVNQALETIRSYVYLPAATTSPSWLDASADRPPALEVLPCKSMSLHIPSGRILAASPALFTINALDFDYEVSPEPPVRWIQFLEQLWGDDLEPVFLLQEWMGYCLISDTRQQKMLMLVGPKRSGKGTIGRMLKCLVGAANVAGPTTTSLASHFGLQDLIGKSLAVVSDARFGGEHVGVAVERLLCISGEDALSIPRKYLPDVTMKLPTRFVFLTNELPKFSDASGALASRFLVLRLTRSFIGQEDTALTEELTTELPGILSWAIEGWKRLRARGHFVQPASSEAIIQDLEDLSSPVRAFVRECCVVGAGHRASKDTLYLAWQGWCAREGRNIVPIKAAFGRDLMAAFPELHTRRGTDSRFYEGIGLQGQYP